MPSKPYQRALIVFAVDTGGRRSELLKLDWQNVDLARGFVTYMKPKNGDDCTIRLTDRAIRVLTDLEPKETGPVFTYRGQPMKDVSTAFA